MFRKRQERKSSHLGIKVAICALAAVGAISIVGCCRDKICCAMNKMTSLFHKKPSQDNPCDGTEC